MTEPFDLRAQLEAIYTTMVGNVIGAVPRIVTGLVYAIIAFLVAKVVERVVRLALVRVHFDAGIGKLGLDQTLRRLGLVQAPSYILSRVAYFLLLFLFVQTGANAMGLEPISQAIGSFLAYLPNLAAAVLLLVAGSAAGQFLGAAVTRAAKGAGIDYGATLGNLVSVLVLAIAGVMALAQLKIQTEIIRIVTACALGGIALAFGISFGLGSRDVTRSIIAGFYARKVFRPGEPMSIRGERGKLRAITPTQTLLQSDDEIIAVPNSVFLDEVVRQ